jgi:outer membrane protein assembly factor BamE
MFDHIASGQNPMPTSHQRMSFAGLAGLAGFGFAASALLTGCGGYDVTRRVADSITPYKVEVVQGNFVSKEQVELLKPGINRQQVRDILGTPLITSVFHTDRWDYVFTLKRQGVPNQERKLTVFFKGNELERFEGDTMPSEADFVAALDVRRKSNRVPVLEATEAELNKFAGPPAARPQAAAETPAPVTYPPLETPSR